MKSLLEELQNISDLQGTPPEQLKWLLEHGTCKTFAEGEYIFKKGDPIDNLYIILKGKFRLQIQQGNQFRTVGAFETQEITGNLPYSRAKEATGVAIATEEAKVFSLHKNHFPHMIRHHFELTEKLVHVMSSRIRKFTKMQQQNDKMMSLGKLSAGLAHELNNPSAAVVRSAQSLKKHLSYLPEHFKSVIKIKLSDQQIDEVNQCMFGKLTQDSPKRSLSEKMNIEEEVAEWLEEEVGFDDGYELAENFVEFDLTTVELEEMRTIVAEEDLKPVLNWINQLFTTERIVREIEDASQRINDLVLSIKSYTHMDQAPERKPADIHPGIENTLKMLNHKIAKANITINKQFEEDLPYPNVLISEMNQVWTNIIDNAIDAMKEVEGNRTLTLATREDGNFIKVDITDSGMGIPDEVLENIFDPFFTTKKVGEGTGLGLDMVQQIIAQHNGSIKVDSKPGKTNFEVCLPIQ